MLSAASDTRSIEDRRRSERGSVVVAMSALMLIALLSVGLITRSQVELRGAAAELDRLAAQGLAEQGVAEMLARLESGERDGFSGGGGDDLGAYKYEATPVSDTSYTVRVQGAVNGAVEEVQLTVGSTARAPYTLFVDTAAKIDSNRGTISGRVVTNGEISASGTTVGDSVDLYGPRASCDGCGPASTFSDALDQPEPVAPTDVVQRCPADGVFTGTIDGESGVPYSCDVRSVAGGTVSFTGTVTVNNPPLIIHIADGLDVSFDNASVNSGGAAEDFQVQAAGGDDYWRLDVYNSKIVGVLYAPGREADIGSASLVGSLAVGVLLISTPDDVWLAEEDTSAPLTSGWTVTSWERVGGS